VSVISTDTSAARVVLVTAASQGIGAGVARHLASRGWSVALLARSAGAESLASELGGVAVRGSITDAAALEQLAERAVARWGRIDAVVNNTGHPGAGAIVTISSYAAVRPDATRPVSSVFRAALSAWTRLMAERLAPRIRVNSLLPGFVDTHPVDPATVATIPAGRPARAGEIATAVEFLLSDNASYITGQNIVIDGGMVR
jgi:NAD(P)-dependent dehydrogenase (short-subunit alcohol dehydrogenase family)